MKLTTLTRGRLPLLALGLLLLGGFAWVVASNGPLAPVRVSIAHAAVTDLRPTLFGIGTVEARRAYAVGPTAAGRLLKMHVDVGDKVTPGQLLAEMDPVDMAERQAAAAASLARSRNALAAADAQVRDAEARTRVAQENARRYAALGRQHFFSPSAVETREQEAVSAQAQEAAAKAARVSAKDDVARLDAEVAAVARQRSTLNLRAPTAALVTAREAEPGSTLVAGQAALRLVDPGSLWVRLRLDQNRAEGMAPGLPASIVLRSRPREAFPGRVVRIEPIGDSITEEKLAMVSFDQPPAGLTVNEMVEVTLNLPPRNAVLTIPNAALRRVGGQEGVWLAAEGRARFRPIKVGVRTQDGQIQVLEGLSRGEAVISYSPRELAVGDRVAVKEGS